MESNLVNRADKRSIITTRITLLTSGLHLAFEIGDLFKQFIYLHLYLRKSIPPSSIRPLCQCIEMLKSVQSTFHRKSAMIAETVAYMIQHMQFSLQRAFYPIKEKLESATKYTAQRLDTLAAATLAMQMLNGSATPDRRLLLHLSMNVLFQMVIFQYFFFLVS
jgi:WASH complex subunit 7